MDRRIRNYYIVTFKKDLFDYCMNAPFCELFSRKRQIEKYGVHAVKIRWYKIGNNPYALISMHRQYSCLFVPMIKYTDGVDEIIKFTPKKEEELTQTMHTIKSYMTTLCALQAQAKIYEEAIDSLSEECYNRIARNNDD